VNWSLALRKDQTMKRKRHTEGQIIAILKEHEAGVKTADLFRKHGISCAALYRRLRSADRRHHRPTGHHRRPDSNRRWIKTGGNVTGKRGETLRQRKAFAF
jgi:hypothetical protein